METRLKIFSALLIPYSFFCAGLYHVAYWIPFNVNGFSYLGIADIVLSFIHPFLYSSFLALAFQVFNYTQLYDALPHGGGNKVPPTKTKRIIWAVLQTLYTTGLVYFLTFLDYRVNAALIPYYVLPGLYFITAEFLLKNNFIKHEKSRFTVLFFIITLPVTSFISGSRTAYEIFDNRKFEYTTNILPGKPLKFLGKASDYYIFVSFDNKDKYVFATEAVKGLNLKDYKKTK